MEFNQQFLKNMEQLLGGEVESFLKSFQKEPACGLRIQKFKITEEQLEKEFDEMIKFRGVKTGIIMTLKRWI